MSSVLNLMRRLALVAITLGLIMAVRVLTSKEYALVSPPLEGKPEEYQRSNPAPFGKQCVVWRPSNKDGEMKGRYESRKPPRGPRYEIRKP